MENAYNQGKKDFLEGKWESPFQGGTKEYAEWARGWDNARNERWAARSGCDIDDFEIASELE